MPSPSNSAFPTTHIERVSEWIVGTSLKDIPGEALRAARFQFADSVAAICAASRSEVGEKLEASLSRTGSAGNCTVLPGYRPCSLYDAIYLHSVMINALEMDNFALMGHLSQSGFAVSLAAGEHLGRTFGEVLRAQLLACEVSGRLAAYMATGPQQGHMRAFVHRCGAAVATSCLLGLDARQTATAISLALSAPEFPLYPASFSPDSKVISTAAPAVEGCRAAFLALEGISATHDILEHPAGFWKYFSYMDYVPDPWRHVGESWSVYALSFKDQASCAYSQGAVVATLSATAGNRFRPDEVKRVEVGLSLLSVAMESFSHPHRAAAITPVNTQFSTRRSVAAALLYGPLNAGFYDAGRFEAGKMDVLRLSGQVHLHHDWQMTIGLARGFDAGLVHGGRPGVLGMGQADQAFRLMRRSFGSPKLISIGDLPDLWRLPAGERRYFFRRYWAGLRGKLPFVPAKRKAQYRSHEGQLDRLQFRIAGSVRIALRDGSVLEGRVDVPPGFAGDAEKYEVAKRKFRREAGLVLGEAGAAAIWERIFARESLEAAASRVIENPCK